VLCTYVLPYDSIPYEKTISMSFAFSESCCCAKNLI